MANESRRREYPAFSRTCGRTISWKMARLTGLEPATPGVTGRYSNQLSYNRIAFARTNPDQT